ncbi:MAG: heavy metal translocating P-type ATPase, partial [Betaproteobacteria bacterium]
MSEIHKSMPTSNRHDHPHDHAPHTRTADVAIDDHCAHEQSGSHGASSDSCCASVPVDQGGVAVGASDCCAAAPVQLRRADQTAAAPDGSRITEIRILQMDCPTEEAMIRNKLDGMAGVQGIAFNLIQRSITVTHTQYSVAPVLQAIRTLGFTPEVIEATATRTLVTEPPKPWWPLLLSGLAALAAEAVGWMGQSTWLVAALAVAAIAGSGLTTYRKGWVAIRSGNLNINALMSIAVTGALLLQHWPEAAMVMVLFTLAERIEALSLERARHAIRDLMQLAPETAMVQQADGQWVSQPAQQVALQARVRVRPGERIALDGVIVEGRTSVNQAPITGESLPVDKDVGDKVFAGTINQSGAFDYRVMAAAGNTTLDHIIHAVEQAQAAKAPTQRWVDAFARIYTPAVLLIAAAVALVPPLLGQGDWLDWIYKALVLLVIACPCALVISTPVSIVSALAAAARKGILVKGGVFLEQGRKLRWLALDKTGTITHGQPVQTDCEAADAQAPDSAVPQWRQLAAGLAARSDHPVSQAIAKAAAADGLLALEVAQFEALPGRGVRGQIDGQPWSLGNWRLVQDMGLATPALQRRLTPLENQGKTVVMLIGASSVRALFAVADTVKPESRDAIAQLHAMGIRTLMLSGDNLAAAQTIASDVGLTEVRGNQLPEDKRLAIEALAGEGVVGMVGDGINDAPALARADIGFAMGALGTDTAIETADVALMDDDLRKIAEFVRLSRATHGVLVQNIVLALGIKLVFLALAVTGLATMWMAVFDDVGA